MFRSSLINGGKRIRYEEYFRDGGEDFHFWYKLSLITKFYNLQQGLLFYRIHGGNLTVQNANQIQSNTRRTLEFAIRELIPLISEDDLECHIRIVEHAPLNVSTADTWFNKMLSANIEKKIYDQNALERRLETELKQIHGRSHPLIYNVRMLKQLNIRYFYNKLPIHLRHYLRNLFLKK
jgi:hypothetical protein